MIEFSGVYVGYGGQPLLRDVSFTAPGGGITALIGPNGCGKTTLLRAAARQLPLLGGVIRLGGRPICDYSRTEYARAASFLPQTRPTPEIKVRSLVEHGRFPYLSLSRTLRPADREAVSRAMEEAGVSDWAERELGELSGGERQRAYIAMLLAQETDTIFLDEPTTHLDIGRQFELLDLLRELCGRGKTVLVVLHDLAHAMQYADNIVLISGGGVDFSGSTAELYGSGRLERVFGIALSCTAEGVPVVCHGA